MKALFCKLGGAEQIAVYERVDDVLHSDTAVPLVRVTLLQFK